MHRSLKKSFLRVALSVVVVGSLLMAMVPGTASAAVTATAVPRIVSVWGLGLLPQPQFDTGPATTKLIVTAPSTATVSVDVAAAITAIFPTAASRIAIFPQAIRDAYAARMASLMAVPFDWNAVLGVWTHDLGTEMAIPAPTAAVRAVAETLLFEEAVLGDVNVPVKVRLAGSSTTTTYKVKITVVDMQRALLPGWTAVSTPAPLGIDQWGAITAMGDGLSYTAAVRWDPAGQMWVNVASSYRITALDAWYVHTTGFEPMGLVFSRATTPPASRPVFNTTKGGWAFVGSSVVRGKDSSGADSYFEMPVNSLLASISGGYTTVVSPGESFSFTERYIYGGAEIGTHDWSFNQDAWVYSAGDSSVPQATAGGAYWVNVSKNGQLAGISQTPLTMTGWNPF